MRQPPKEDGNARLLACERFEGGAARHGVEQAIGRSIKVRGKLAPRFARA
jgi:hypothetical protein